MHNDVTGARCDGSGNLPIFSAPSWWRSLKFRRLSRAAYSLIFTGFAGTLSVLAYFGLSPGSSANSDADVAQGSTLNSQSITDSGIPSEAPPVGDTSVPPLSEAVADVSASGLSAAATDIGYRVFLPIQNSGERDSSIESISIVASWDGGPCAEVPLYFIVEIDDVLLVDRGNVVAGSATTPMGLSAGSSVPTRGIADLGCGGDQVQFSLVPPNALLLHDSTTIVSIGIPYHFNISRSNDPSFPSGSVDIPQLSVETSPEQWYVDLVAFRLTANMSGAESLTSCFVLSAGEIQGGPHDCADRVGGMDLFRVQDLDVNRPLGEPPP